MTMLPPDELWALPEKIEIGTIVLELGNKRNSTGLYRDWYTDQGLEYVCLDWNGLDGAIPLDMRYAIEPDEIMNGMERGFDVVTNFGFSEHVEDQMACWRNIHNFVGVGGKLAICMPMMPDWIGHGLWMPTLKWYDMFAMQNGYSYEMKIWDRKRRTICARMTKDNDWEFTMPVGEIIGSERR